MANYHRRPLVAGSEDDTTAVWLTPDAMYRITLHKACPIDRSCYTVSERHLSRIADSAMHILWYDVLSHVDRTIVQDALNVILYPAGSEPSPEWAGVGNDPRTDLPPDIDFDEMGALVGDDE